jgi:hypothetical protein
MIIILRCAGLTLSDVMSGLGMKLSGQIPQNEVIDEYLAREPKYLAVSFIYKSVIRRCLVVINSAQERFKTRTACAPQRER